GSGPLPRRRLRRQRQTVAGRERVRRARRARDGPDAGPLRAARLPPGQPVREAVRAAAGTRQRRHVVDLLVVRVVVDPVPVRVAVAVVVPAVVVVLDEPEPDPRLAQCTHAGLLSVGGHVRGNAPPAHPLAALAHPRPSCSAVRHPPYRRPPARASRVVDVRGRRAHTRPGRSSLNNTVVTERHDVVRGSRPGYRTGARFPSSALPIRTCVAPCASAASRSWLMPADSAVAAGWAARIPAATSASNAKARSGAQCSGATAIRPASRRL